MSPRSAISEASLSHIVRVALDGALDPVFIHRPDGSLVYWNWAAASSAGYEDTDVSNVPPWAWSNTTDAVRLERLGELESRGAARFACHRVGKNVPERHVEISSRWIETEDGPLIISFEHDVSEHTKAERALRDMAFRDPLTGLANRAMLEDRLKLAIANARRHHDTLGVLFVDLDDFKPINDTHGHAVGDKLLKMTAQRMLGAVRTEDTVARVGGDEFVVVLPRLRERGALGAAAEKLREIIGEPFEIEGRVACRVTATIGHAVFDPDTDDAHTLLIRADLAMYHARQTGAHIAGAEPLD